ncbi:terminase, partial [Salmonella enterica]|nr:terminase [Salmonella enterica]
EIERLERALKPKAEAAPRKTTKPRTRKPAARPAAKRGRPPKAVKTAG